MAQNNVGTATVEVRADTRQFEKDLENLQTKALKIRTALSWPEAFTFVSSLGFVGYLIHVIWG